jgi:hypothetical protein
MQKQASRCYPTRTQNMQVRAHRYIFLSPLSLLSLSLAFSSLLLSLSSPLVRVWSVSPLSLPWGVFPSVFTPLRLSFCPHSNSSCGTFRPDDYSLWCCGLQEGFHVVFGDFSSGQLWTSTLSCHRVSEETRLR